jgi:hypothetical protein
MQNFTSWKSDLLIDFGVFVSSLASPLHLQIHFIARKRYRHFMLFMKFAEEKAHGITTGAFLSLGEELN